MVAILTTVCVRIVLGSEEYAFSARSATTPTRYHMNEGHAACWRSNLLEDEAKKAGVNPTAARISKRSAANAFSNAYSGARGHTVSPWNTHAVFPTRRSFSIEDALPRV